VGSSRLMMRIVIFGISCRRRRDFVAISARHAHIQENQVGPERPRLPLVSEASEASAETFQLASVAGIPVTPRRTRWLSSAIGIRIEVMLLPA